LDRFSPFRLLAVEAGERGSSFMALETSWDRSSVRNIEHPRGPLCVVSSGLGDPLVKPRLALFEEILRAEGAEGGDAPGAIQAQDRFHRHSWPDRPEISVLMRRPDARTVSITTVDVEKHAPADAVVLMSYEPVPDEPVPGPKSRRSERPATAGRRS
jgi:hypothetical protein